MMKDERNTKERSGDDRSQKWSKNKNKDNRRDRRESGNNRRNANRDEANRSNNDASWYKVTDQIMKDAGMLSFNNPLGMGVTGILDGGTHYFPGVCALWYAPTIGEANSATSPINLQAKKLISWFRSQVSNKLTFAAADAMMYYLAMDSMYALYSYCVRLYGIHRSYISTNRYYPQGLLQALNVNADAKSDWTKFRTWINTWAYQLSQVFVPNSIAYFARHMWMNANVYLDSADSKAQSYLFTPQYLYKWSSKTDVHGTCLIPVTMPTADTVTYPDGATLEDIIDFGDALLTELIENIDVGELSGINLRAYGEKNCLKLSTIPEDFQIAPVYNPEVMPQIHNATICGSVITGTSPIDNPSALVQQTEYDTLDVYYDVQTTAHVTSVRMLTKRRVLDMEVPTPSVDDVFVATRLMATSQDVISPWTRATLKTFGTEIVTKAVIVSIMGPGLYEKSVIDGGAVIVSAPSVSSGSILKLIGKLSNFRNFPLIGLGYEYDETNHEIVSYLGELTNYTDIGSEDLQKLHSAATIALFDIPTIGS